MRIVTICVVFALAGCSATRGTTPTKLTSTPVSAVACHPVTISSGMGKDPRIEEAQRELLSRLKESSESDNELVRELGVEKLNTLLSITKRVRSGQSSIAVDVSFHCNDNGPRTQIILKETQKGCLLQGFGFMLSRSVPWSSWEGPLFCFPSA